MISRRIGGWSLIVAAVLFWLSWFLMPEPGTVDAAFILKAIAAQRGLVLTSAIVQTICAVGLVLGVLSITGARSTLVTVGAALTLVGALGNAADAVYHQLAYEMTAPDVDRAAMLPVMTRMQTVQIRLLVPLLVSFLPGAACLCIGLAREERGPRENPRVAVLFAAALGLAVAAAVAARGFGVSPRPISLSALALFSFAIAATGWQLLTSPNRP
jgi:hypothetical protein